MEITQKEKKDVLGYQLCTLKEIFNNGKRAFRVPEYQRGYSWETPQRIDLLKDLEYLIDGDYTHYTGTIVATESHSIYSKKSPCYDVVDGQQRLTTSVLLLASIYYSYGKEEELPDSIKAIPKLFLFSGRDTGNTIRKFYLQEEQDYLFYELIQGKIVNHIAKTKSEQNLLDASNEFKTWVNSNLNLREVITQVLTERLGFLYYTPTNSKEIGIMFEVINNRGKKLSELEKVKNYLIYFADKNDIGDLKERVNKLWGNILSNLNSIGYYSNERENSFLRNCWIVFRDHRKSESFYPYNYIKQYYPVNESKHWSTLITFVEFLEEASETFVKLKRRTLVKDKNEIAQLTRIALHGVDASILPLIISIYSKIKDSTKRIDLLSLIEKLNFRFYVLGVATRSDTGQGDLFKAAYRFYHGIEEYQSYDKLKAKLVQFVEWHVPDRTFAENFLLDKDADYNFYKWAGLKFFLASYEEELRKKSQQSTDLVHIMASEDKQNPNDFFHKEHIWATKEWKIIDDRDFPDLQKRRLSNFILLKKIQNIKVSNHRIEDKVNQYYWKDRENEPNTLMIRELKTDFQKAQKIIDSKRAQQNKNSKTKKYWRLVYKTFFDIREQKLVDFALKRWSIPELSINKQVESIKINSFSEESRVYFITMKSKQEEIEK